MEQTIQQTLKRHWRVTYVGFALLVAILYDVFFWGLQPGFGFVLFVAFYVLGFSVLSLLSDQIRHPKALLLLIPIFIFSLDILFYNNDFSTFCDSLYGLIFLTESAQSFPIFS